MIESPTQIDREGFVRWVQKNKDDLEYLLMVI